MFGIRDDGQPVRRETGIRSARKEPAPMSYQKSGRPKMLKVFRVTEGSTKKKLIFDEGPTKKSSSLKFGVETDGEYCFCVHKKKCSWFGAETRVWYFVFPMQIAPLSDVWSGGGGVFLLIHETTLLPL